MEVFGEGFTLNDTKEDSHKNVNDQNNAEGNSVSNPTSGTETNNRKKSISGGIFSMNSLYSIRRKESLSKEVKRSNSSSKI